MSAEICAGTRIDHDRYGEGIVSRVMPASYEVFFARGGKIEFSRSSRDFVVIESPETASSESTSDSGFDYDALAAVLADVLERYDRLSEEVELGDKWTGGKLVLLPGKEGLQQKEIPVEQFFHKIVMLRDRLRVLEQNINSHSALTDEEKVGLQQYITRCYGSLTTFNLLFADKKQYFQGSGKKEE
jgi:hypothetical protein